MLYVTTIQLNINQLYILLSDQTVLFQEIQFRISHLFVFSFNIIDPLIGPYKLLQLQGRVNLEAMVMKGLLLGWLFGFYGISTFGGYLMPNPFLYK